MTQNGDSKILSWYNGTLLAASLRSMKKNTPQRKHDMITLKSAAGRELHAYSYMHVSTCFSTGPVFFINLICSIDCVARSLCESAFVRHLLFVQSARFRMWLWRKCVVYTCSKHTLFQERLVHKVVLRNIVRNHLDVQSKSVTKRFDVQSEFVTKHLDAHHMKMQVRDKAP